MILKKSFFAVITAIVAAGAALGITCAAIQGSSACATDVKTPTVVIDAGHGGIDNGVVGISSDTDEADINLAIAKFLKGDFLNAGFNVVMTRSTEAGLYGTTEKGFKARDMKKRKEIIEKSEADMVISVHQNFCPLPSKRGGIVFYKKDSEEGKSLAEKIQSELNDMPECVKAAQALTGDYFMLKCTTAPSVIVECGFLSNEEDDKLLNTTEYQSDVAYSIFKGAVSYFACKT